MSLLEFSHILPCLLRFCVLCLFFYVIKFITSTRQFHSYNATPTFPEVWDFKKMHRTFHFYEKMPFNVFNKPSNTRNFRLASSGRSIYIRHA